MLTRCSRWLPAWAASISATTVVLAEEDACKVSHVDEAHASDAALSRMDRVERMTPYQQYKTRLYGNYENRLRLHSDPEKVFEYFASVEGEDEEERFMTPDDFVHAITPYNPAVHTLEDVRTRNTKYDYSARHLQPTAEDKRRCVEDIQLAASGHAAAAKRLFSTHTGQSPPYNLDPPSRIEAIHQAGLTNAKYNEMMLSFGYHVSCDVSLDFAQLVDQDGDGLLSFGEYMFFLTLLAIPSHQFVLAFRMFDTNDDKGIDQEEFQKIMSIMRNRHPQGRAVRDKNLLGQDKHRVDAGGVLAQFFGVDGSKMLTPQAFGEYVYKVQRTIREREFALADVGGTGYLSPLEFALFLVSHAPTEDQARLVERAKEYTEGHTGGAVSKAEFLAFTDLLSHLPLFKVALDVVTPGNRDGVNPAEFRHATRAVLKSSDITGVDMFDSSLFSIRRPRTVANAGLSELQVDVIFALFDENGDGELDQSEFLDVMHSRAHRGLDKARGFELGSVLSKLKNCVGSSSP